MTFSQIAALCMLFFFAGFCVALLGVEVRELRRKAAEWDRLQRRQ